jgi:hypothetical protein
MTALSRRTLRRTAVVLSALFLSSGLAACEKDDTVQRLVLDALDRSMASPRAFVHVDQDLNHTTTVSGELADSLRYRMLLNVDGKPIWQQVVRDDAVADLFLDTSQIATYAGAGSSPAVNVVTDYQKLAPTIPKEVPPPPFGMLPKTQPLTPSLALSALQQGKWVLDKAGAPVLPTVGTSNEVLATSPFLRPLLMLAAVRQEVDKVEPTGIKKYSEDDLSPMFKPKDDPFPKPGPGEDRYDLAQAPLPEITATSAGSRPDAPGDASLRKIAIYIKDGRVVAVRESYDILDRLEDLARLYQVPLELNKSLGTVTQQRIGQLLVQLVQAERPTPFRVREEHLLITYPTVAPRITLPAPYVAADLSLFPGQGRPEPAAEADDTAGNTGADAAADTGTDPAAGTG